MIRNYDTAWYYAVPWLFAFCMAAVFALLARKAGRSMSLRGIAGFIIGLGSTTMALGLGDASVIPISYEATSSFHTKSVLLALLLNVVLCWIFTASLHGQHLAICRGIFGRFGGGKAGPSK